MKKRNRSADEVRYKQLERFYVTLKMLGRERYEIKPGSREAEKIDKYCNRQVQVDLIIESDKDADSWSQVSSTPEVNKQS